MKICLVYPDVGGVDYYGARKYYHGLGYLSSVLKQAGHETSLLYLEREQTADDFVAQVEALNPCVVAFSATTNQYPYVVRCAAWLKRALPATLTVVGGTHPTLVPEQVLGSRVFDALCVGEGEYPLLDLVTFIQDGRDPSSIANLWFSRPEGDVRNSLRPLLSDLDTLPFADRDLFSFSEILAANDGWVDMMAGRGCPYGCSYCSNPGLRERYRGLGKYVRMRSVANLLTEIRELSSQYRIKVLNFQDDVFTLDREWALDFGRAYGEEFKYPYWINTRVERITDEELVECLAKSGCRGVRIGLESGNEALRAQVLKRTMSNEQIRQAFALADRYGLDVYTCNMLGIPGETAAMIDETIALNRELKPAGMQFSVFYPYPMTELYETCVREGYLAEDAELKSYYERKSVLHLPTLSQTELERAYDRFEQLKLELQMKHTSPPKYRVYQLLLWLMRGNSLKARSILRHLGRLRDRLLNRQPSDRLTRSSSLGDSKP